MIFMAHSFSMVWIHGVFGTKNRMPLIDKTFEGQLHDHIKTYLSAVGNVEEYIRGQKEHHKSWTFMEEYENFIEDYTSDETVKTVFE